MRAILTVLLFSAFLTDLPLCAAEQKLNLFIWSEYIDPGIVGDFEKKFGCRVTIDLYEDAESMLAKVQNGGVALYDVVVPPDYMITAMIKLKLLAPLRPENLPNLRNLEEQFASPAYDPGNKFTAAYQWGTLGILVRESKDKPLPRSWAVFFDNKAQPGPMVLLDSMRDMLGAALKYKGHSLNTTQAAQLKEARELLVEAKNRSLGFEGSVGGKNKVLGKSARAAIVYSGEGVRAMKEDQELVYFVPEEGGQIWVDNLAVLAKAPHRDLAEKFINYILDAKVGARLSNFTHYASPNKAARPFIRPEDLQNSAIYPSEEVRKRLEFLQDLGASNRLYDEIWTQVKTR